MPEPTVEWVAVPTVTPPDDELLATTTVTVDESVVLPALSVARATIVYVPFAGCEFHVTEYGEVVSGLPIVVPEANEHDQPAQYRNSTCFTPDSASLADAVTDWPFWMVAPPVGAVIDTVGGFVSFTFASAVCEEVAWLPTKSETWSR